jgi:hypothetical protein
MSMFGLERRPELEAGFSVRAFRPNGIALTRPDALQILLERFPSVLAEHAKESPVEFVALDLQGLGFEFQTSIQFLNKLAAQLTGSGWRFVCVVDPKNNSLNSTTAKSFATVANPDELYEWLVDQGVRRRANSPEPLFSMNAAEIADLRANGVELGGLIHELEALKDAS